MPAAAGRAAGHGGPCSTLPRSRSESSDRTCIPHQSLRRSCRSRGCRWDLRAHEAFVQHVLPDPCVQILVEPAALRDGRRDQPVLCNADGQPLRLRPEVPAWRVFPFTRRPVAALTNRTERLTDPFPGADESQLQELAAEADGPGLMAALEGLLCNATPAPPHHCTMCSASSNGSPTIPRCSRWSTSHVSSASARDRFSACSEPMWGPAQLADPALPHQGSGRSYRGGRRRQLADLAGQLGYADQSHFINDFRRLVGRSPGEYAVRRMTYRRTQPFVSPDDAV